MTLALLLFFLLFPYAGCSAFSPPAAAVRRHHAAAANSISSELASWRCSVSTATSSSYFGGGGRGARRGGVSIMRRGSNDTPSYCRAPNNRLHHPRRSASPSMLSATNSAVNNQTSSSSSSSSSHKKRIAIIFAFLTGWVDYIFIKKYNYFATMHTGNTMKMAIAIIDGRYHDTIFYTSVILSYMMGVGIYHRAELSIYKDEGVIHALFAPIVATCFVLSDNLLLLLPTAAAATTATATTTATFFKLFTPASLLSFAWGIINQIGNDVTGTLIFVVTGAMTRISTMMVDRLSRTAGRKTMPKDNLLLALSVIIGFILGAAWSACVSVHISQQHYLNRRAFSIIGVIYGLLFLWLDRREIWSMVIRVCRHTKKEKEMIIVNKCK